MRGAGLGHATCFLFVCFNLWLLFNQNILRMAVLATIHTC